MQAQAVLFAHMICGRVQSIVRGCSTACIPSDLDPVQQDPVLVSNPERFVGAPQILLHGLGHALQPGAAPQVVRRVAHMAAPARLGADALHARMIAVHEGNAAVCPIQRPQAPQLRAFHRPVQPQYVSPNPCPGPRAGWGKGAWPHLCKARRVLH